MLIDSHFHLTDEKYKNNEKRVIEDAIKEGVTRFITIGTSTKDNEKVTEIVKKFDNLYGTVGIYPHEDLNLNLHTIENNLKIQATKDKIVGIGECGLDKSNYESTRSLEDQKLLFEMQINLALKYNLPLVIHNRDYDTEIFEILRKYPEVKGVAHCFVSDWTAAKTYLDLNFYISFSGIITYPSGKDILETVKKVPLDRFLIETDAPYLSPQGYRNKVNEPKYVKMIARKIAEVREIDINQITDHSYQNTCRIFNLDKEYDDQNRE